jgi:hypothetical protein
VDASHSKDATAATAATNAGGTAGPHICPPTVYASSIYYIYVLILLCICAYTAGSGGGGSGGGSGAGALGSTYVIMNDMIYSMRFAALDLRLSADKSSGL